MVLGNVSYSESVITYFSSYRNNTEKWQYVKIKIIISYFKANNHKIKTVKKMRFGTKTLKALY